MADGGFPHPSVATSVATKGLETKSSPVKIVNSSIGYLGELLHANWSSRADPRKPRLNGCLQTNQPIASKINHPVRSQTN